MCQRILFRTLRRGEGTYMFALRRRQRLAILLLGAFVSGPMIWSPDRGLAATPEEVDAAIDKAKAILYSRQKEGLWETHPTPVSNTEAESNASRVTGGQWAGETALAVYALLAAGEPSTEPRLQKAIKFLLSADIKGTYALGLRAQLYNFLPQTRQTRVQAEEDVAAFNNAMIQKDPARGLFDYLLNSTRASRLDHSVSQYGVLGAWACERAGVEVPTQFWQQVEAAWIRDQGKDGSWSYGNSDDERRGPTASMTVAGVATLFITQDYVHANNGIQCTGNIDNPNIEAGLKWIGDHFDRVFTDRGADSPYYAVYGVERVGVASGRKHLGAVDWYARGADFLVKNQSKRGGGGWGSTIDTSFAVLFLARGRAPVIINKLQYDSGGKEAEWNQRPRDVANLTRWISTKTERDLNWQIVSLRGSASELLDAPVLYMSGSKALQLSVGDEAKLREYCESGGLILGNADCESSAFSQSFRKLGTRLFKDYEFRNLPVTHPLYTNEQYPRTNWKPAPSVLGLSNGIREMMLLTINSDPGRHWQLQETGRNLADFEFADNVILYAVDKNNLVEKGRTFTVSLDPNIPTTRTIKLARLKFAGNWNPEPGGWRRMVAMLHNRSGINLDISVANLGSGELRDGKAGPKVAVLTGTNTFKLDTAARQEIKNFIEGGGTLIVDAAGGDSDFAAAAEGELSEILGHEAAKQLKVPLPLTDPIYNLPGGTIKEFAYRPYARISIGSMHGPLIAAVTMGNRPSVYYSRWDLSAGMVGQPTDGITGYEPAVATAIMNNLVISAGLGPKASVTPTK